MVSPLEDCGIIPDWLKPMLKASYFVPCDIHGDSNRSECNMFCLDCLGNAFCSYCSLAHKGHSILQIRRSSYHNGVRINEVQKHLDISCIQPYVINSFKIVFLNERPQAKPIKGVTSNCEICCRSLLDYSFRFCSIACKLAGVKRGDPELTFTPKMKHNRDGSDSDDSSTQRKIQRRNLMMTHEPCSISSNGPNGSSDIVSSSSANESVRNILPATPPISNRRHRRKGIPRRAPAS